MTRRRARGLVLAAVLGALGAAGCGGSQHRPPSRLAPTDAVVKIKADVADAGVWIDGAFIGSLGEMRGGIALDPGAHRLELRHEAYFVHYQELALGPGQRLTLAIELAPILP